MGTLAASAYLFVWEVFCSKMILGSLISSVVGEKHVDEIYLDTYGFSGTAQLWL